MNNPFFYCLIAAFCFGIWPLIARFANLSQGMFLLTLGLGTGVLSLFFINNWQFTSKSLLLGLACGLVNGIGIIAYSKVINWHGAELSKLIPIIAVLMPIFTVVGAVTFLGEPLTIKKVAGIFMVAFAIYLLS